MGADMHSRTVAGLMVYCDYLKEKGYQGASATDSWKSATKMVFETVEPEAWETMSLEGIDLADTMRRFQVLAGSKLRAETVSVYERRIRRAMEAQAFYLENGKPPTFKRGNARPKADDAEASKGSKAKPEQQQTEPTTTTAAPAQGADLMVFPFPLRDGRVVRLHLPPSGLTKSDAERLGAFIRTLSFEEQAQIPERTGKAIAA